MKADRASRSQSRGTSIVSTPTSVERNAFSFSMEAQITPDRRSDTDTPAQTERERRNSDKNSSSLVDDEHVQYRGE
jgi:hypothetical protein